MTNNTDSQSSKNGIWIAIITVFGAIAVALITNPNDSRGAALQATATALEIRQHQIDSQATTQARNTQPTATKVEGRLVTQTPEPEPPPLVPLPGEANNPTGARLICTRQQSNDPCYDGGALNFRSTPCYIENGANIIGVLSNYTRVELIEQNSFPSASGCDSSVRWYYISFEGEQCYISSADKYSRPSK